MQALEYRMMGRAQFIGGWTLLFFSHVIDTVDELDESRTTEISGLRRIVEALHEFCAPRSCARYRDVQKYIHALHQNPLPHLSRWENQYAPFLVRQRGMLVQIKSAVQSVVQRKEGK